MISYCICCYRPRMDEILIDELARKTSARYETLLWYNTADQGLAEFVRARQAQGLPIKVVGSTPENIGMKAFKPLFQAAAHDMIVQLDDDVTVVTPRAAEICDDIFRRRPEVKQIVSDVWQDEFTSGAHPGASSYKPYAPEDGLYEGPIDGGFSVYHRSILPLLMQVPYEKYFYLGAWIRGGLPSSNCVGLLCRKIKIFHVYGAIYASAYGMLDFEFEKFRNVGLHGIADGFARWRDRLPPKENILERIEAIKRALSAVPS